MLSPDEQEIDPSKAYRYPQTRHPCTLSPCHCGVAFVFCGVGSLAIMADSPEKVDQVEEATTEQEAEEDAGEESPKKVGLLDAPPVVTGKRQRKKVDVFKPASPQAEITQPKEVRAAWIPPVHMLAVGVLTADAYL